MVDPMLEAESVLHEMFERFRLNVQVPLNLELDVLGAEARKDLLRALEIKPTIEAVERHVAELRQLENARRFLSARSRALEKLAFDSF